MIRVEISKSKHRFGLLSTKRSSEQYRTIYTLPLETLAIKTTQPLDIRRVHHKNVAPRPRSLS